MELTEGAAHRFHPLTLDRLLQQVLVVDVILIGLHHHNKQRLSCFARLRPDRSGSTGNAPGQIVDTMVRYQLQRVLFRPVTECLRPLVLQVLVQLMGALAKRPHAGGNTVKLNESRPVFGIVHKVGPHQQHRDAFGLTVIKLAVQCQQAGKKIIGITAIDGQWLDGRGKKIVILRHAVNQFAHQGHNRFEQLKALTLNKCRGKTEGAVHGAG